MDWLLATVHLKGKLILKVFLDDDRIQTSQPKAMFPLDTEALWYDNCHVSIPLAVYTRGTFLQAGQQVICSSVIFYSHI